MPRRIYPGRELGEPFVVKCDAPFGSDEKAVGGYRPCWATVKAGSTILAPFHHLWLSPIII
jgi:hypothetical protein